MADEKVPVEFGPTGLELGSLDQAWRFAKGVIEGGMAPKGLSSPGAVVALIQAGAEIGLPPMFSLSYLTFINGRLGIMGQASLALVRKADVCKPDGQPTARWEGEGDERKAVYRAHRKDAAQAVEASFSVSDAKRMGLWKKGGPWTTDPEEMLAWRAWSRLAKRHFADVILGMGIEEEVRDHRPLRGVTVRDITPPKERDPLLGPGPARTPDPEPEDASGEAISTEPEPQDPEPEEEPPVPDEPPEVIEPEVMPPEEPTDEMGLPLEPRE